jgi:hypothetical protein
VETVRSREPVPRRQRGREAGEDVLARVDLKRPVPRSLRSLNRQHDAQWDVINFI